MQAHHIHEPIFFPSDLIMRLRTFVYTYVRYTMTCSDTSHHVKRLGGYLAYAVVLYSSTY